MKTPKKDKPSVDKTQEMPVVRDLKDTNPAAPPVIESEAVPIKPAPVNSITREMPNVEALQGATQIPFPVDKTQEMPSLRKILGEAADISKTQVRGGGEWPKVKPVEFIPRKGAPKNKAGSAKEIPLEVEEIQMTGISNPARGAKLLFKKRLEATSLVGCVIGTNYKITEKLSVGGMGVIYKGIQISTDQEVVLKTVKQEYLKSTQLLQKFIQEKNVISRLNHPNIVKLLDFVIQEDGPMFIIMEYLHGRHLFEYTRSKKPTLEAVIDIMIQICDALYFAHGKKVIHRDLKPENIYVLDEPENFVKILDFGIAKLFKADPSQASNPATFTGIVGTPRYMSPEQALGIAVDNRSDVYSFGIILYELLPLLFAGIELRPFNAFLFNDLDIIGYLKGILPPSPQVERIVYILSKTLAFKKDNRFTSMIEIRKILKEFDKPLDLSQLATGAEGAPIEPVYESDLEEGLIEIKKKRGLPLSWIYRIAWLVSISILLTGVLLLFTSRGPKTAYLAQALIVGPFKNIDLPKWPLDEPEKNEAKPKGLVKVTFVSKPEMVRVKFKDKEPLITPFTLEFVRDFKKKISLKAAKDGYQTKVFYLTPLKEERYLIELQKIATIFYRPPVTVPVQKTPAKSKKEDEIITKWK